MDNCIITFKKEQYVQYVYKHYFEKDDLLTRCFVFILSDLFSW